MFQRSHIHEEGAPSVTVKHEMITVKEEYDEIDAAAPDFDDLKDLDDPLEINEKDRELFLQEEELAKKEPEVVITTRGAPGLVYQGYTYTKYYISKSKRVIRWRCQRTKGCRGGLDTNLKCKVPRVQEEHSHPPNYIATEAAKLKYSLYGHRLCNFLREDGTFVVPYKENAKKMLKAQNPFGIQNTQHSWHLPAKSQTPESQTTKNTVSGKGESL